MTDFSLPHLWDLLTCLEQGLNRAERRKFRGVFVSFSIHADVRKAVLELIEVRKRRPFLVPNSAPWSLDQLARQYVEHVLHLEAGDKKAAARRLGINKATIYRALPSAWRPKPTKLKRLLKAGP